MIYSSYCVTEGKTVKILQSFRVNHYVATPLDPFSIYRWTRYRSLGKYVTYLIYTESPITMAENALVSSRRLAIRNHRDHLTVTSVTTIVIPYYSHKGTTFARDSKVHNPLLSVELAGSFPHRDNVPLSISSSNTLHNDMRSMDYWKQILFSVLHNS